MHTHEIIEQIQWLLVHYKNLTLEKALEKWQSQNGTLPTYQYVCIIQAFDFISSSS